MTLLCHICQEDALEIKMLTLHNVEYALNYIIFFLVIFTSHSKLY